MAMRDANSPDKASLEVQGQNVTSNKKKAPKKPGPVPGYLDWEDDDHILLLSGWKRNGLTDEQIANNMGIDISTFYRWKDKSCVIKDALKKSKEMADLEVENALFEAAMSGNITAQIFWLKNRNTKRWRDRPAEEDNASKEIKVTIAGSEYAE